MDNKDRTQLIQLKIGERPNESDAKQTLLKQLIELRTKYPTSPEMHETEMQEREAWANMTPRASYEQNTAHRTRNARN